MLQSADAQEPAAPLTQKVDHRLRGLLAHHAAYLAHSVAQGARAQRKLKVLGQAGHVPGDLVLQGAVY